MEEFRTQFSSSPTFPVGAVSLKTNTEPATLHGLDLSENTPKEGTTPADHAVRMPRRLALAAALSGSIAMVALGLPFLGTETEWAWEKC